MRVYDTKANLDNNLGVTVRHSWNSNTKYN